MAAPSHPAGGRKAAPLCPSSPLLLLQDLGSAGGDAPAPRDALNRAEQGSQTLLRTTAHTGTDLEAQTGS